MDKKLVCLRTSTRAPLENMDHRDHQEMAFFFDEHRYFERKVACILTIVSDEWLDRRDTGPKKHDVSGGVRIGMDS